MSVVAGQNKRLAMEECQTFHNEIKQDEKQVKCVYCGNSLHMKCAGISKSRYNRVQKSHCYYCSSQCEFSHTTNKKIDELLTTMKCLQVTVDKINGKCDKNGLNQKKSDEAMKKLPASIVELSKFKNEMKSSMEDVKSSQMFISAQYEDVKSLHEEMKKDFAGCLSTVSDHDLQFGALSNSVSEMKKRLRLAEQIGLKHEIVINGIP